MQALSVKKILQFRHMSERRKRSFISKIFSSTLPAKNEGGGNYWITSISAVSQSFKRKSNSNVIEKRIQLEDKYAKTEFKRIKVMYERNIAILYNYEKFDFNEWWPTSEIQLIKKPKSIATINIKGLNVQINPHHVFCFENKGVDEIGAIWFVAMLGRLSLNDLGLFTEALFNYLKRNYSQQFRINTDFCMANNISTGESVNYSQINSGEILPGLFNVIGDIKNIMNS